MSNLYPIVNECDILVYIILVIPSSMAINCKSMMKAKKFGNPFLFIHHHHPQLLLSWCLLLVNVITLTHSDGERVEIYTC